MGSDCAWLGPQGSPTSRSDSILIGSRAIGLGLTMNTAQSEESLLRHMCRLERFRNLKELKDWASSDSKWLRGQMDALVEHLQPKAEKLANVVVTTKNIAELRAQQAAD